jgi:hypothetical protein
MTSESLACFLTVRRNEYGQSDPPMLGVLWKSLELFVAGPLGFFVLQVVTLSAGLWAILCRTFSPRGAAWAATGLLVFPPIMVPMAAIWPHSMMAGFLMLGTAGLLSERRSMRIAGAGALFAATAVHPAALVATLPLLVVLGVGLGPWHADRGSWQRPVIALVTWLAVTAAALGANAALGARPTLPGVSERAWRDRLEASPDPMVALTDRQPDTMLKRGVPTRTSELQDAMVDGVRGLARTPIFVPWIYLALAVVFLPLARRHREVLAILGSGVLYELSLFTTATSSDYRQSHWMIACTCTAIVVLAAHRARRARAA